MLLLLAGCDFAADSANLFRRNSIAPKILSKYALTVGDSHLQEVLKPLVENVCHSAKTFEVCIYSAVKCMRS